MTSACWRSLLSAALLLGCGSGELRAFEPSADFGEAGEGGASGGAAGGSAAGGAAGSNPAGGGSLAGSAPAAGSSAGGIAGASGALLIDDFEDGDTRARMPLGWWYPVNDGSGAQGFGIEPVGAGGTSVYALRTHGNSFTIWGAAVGVDLNAEGPLDARSQRQLCFAVRTEQAQTQQVSVHLLRDGAHYVQNAPVTDTWTRRCLPLAGFIGPGDVPLVPDRIIALQFFFEPNAPFVLWLDDIELGP